MGEGSGTSVWHLNSNEPAYCGKGHALKIDLFQRGSKAAKKVARNQKYESKYVHRLRVRICSKTTSSLDGTDCSEARTQTTRSIRRGYLAVAVAPGKHSGAIQLQYWSTKKER